MNRGIGILALSMVLLAACGSVPAGSASALPTPTETPTPTAEPTEAPSPTPAPTMTVYDPVTFEDWLAGAGCAMPSYTFSAPHAPQAPEKTAWPEGDVTLYAEWRSSLEEAAETFGVPAETLRVLNPDYAWDGTWGEIRLQEEPYSLSYDLVTTITVKADWPGTFTEKVDFPSSLDKQAQAALATATFFYYNYYGLGSGYGPGEKVEDPEKWYYYRAVEGAPFVKYSDFTHFLGRFFSDGEIYKIAGSPDALYTEGKDDTLLFGIGGRGTNLLYCSTLYTEPEQQPDGSLQFWQLSLRVEEENFHGWDVEEPLVPTAAFVSPVRLIPTENGWRVDAYTLPN